MSKWIDRMHKQVPKIVEYTSSAVQYTINNTFHVSLKVTPSKILLGYELRNHPDVELTKYLDKVANAELNGSRYRTRS